VLDIVLSGHVSWTSAKRREVDVGIGWIRPTTTDPVDAETSFRLPSAEHNYGAGVPVADAQDVSAGLAAIHEAIGRAHLMTDTLSFLTGHAVSWCPARVLPMVDKPHSTHDGKERQYREYMRMPSRAEMTSVVITDEWIEGPMGAFLKMVWGLNPKLRDVVLTAISWQAQANRVGGFSRYLHYWASVELLAGFFWNELPRAQTQRIPDSEVRQRVLEYLLDLKSSNYVEMIDKCRDALEPSARMQVKALARIIDFDSDTFFKRRGRDRKSVLDVRNDIAHGNVPNNDRSYAEMNREILDRCQRQTQEFVVRVALAAGRGVLKV
jgi:hypothetical protein